MTFRTYEAISMERAATAKIIQIEESGVQDIEINERIVSAAKVYHAIKSTIIRKREISRNTKMKVYKSIFRPILTYGCEGWILDNRTKSKIQSLEMKYLRAVKGITRCDRIRNSDVREELGIKSMTEFIENKQLGWWGHLQRMHNQSQVKQVWEAKPQGRKRKGRPKKTWDEVIAEIITTRGSTWREAKQTALDKKAWFKFIND
uniref:Endonuclease-reverse transcriptase n=1 Tax=Photinus pyralis TaxID=7054 RepID=A0A1Y1K5K2_PHOPY